LLMHLVPLDRGTIAFDGKAVGAGEGLSRRGLHRQMQMVFQDSYASLTPRLPVAMSIAFGPLVHGLAKSAALARAMDLLQAVGLDPMLFAAARQQPNRLLLEFIRVLTTRCTHQTPSCSFRSLPEVSTISGEGHLQVCSNMWTKNLRELSSDIRPSL